MATPAAPPAFGPRRPSLPLQLSPATLLKLGSSASSRVAAEGKRLIELVREEAGQDALGPQAVFCRRIQGRLDSLLPRMRALESQMGRATSARTAVQGQLDELEQSFYRDVALDLSWLRDELQRRNQSSMFDTVQKKLPPYIQEAIRREGIWVPGVPGTFKPTGGVPPTGIEWKVTF